MHAPGIQEKVTLCRAICDEIYRQLATAYLLYRNICFRKMIKLVIKSTVFLGTRPEAIDRHCSRFVCCLSPKNITQETGTYFLLIVRIFLYIMLIMPY